MYERATQRHLGISAFRPGESMMRVLDEACADFESLLFHGRAALDILTRFVASEHSQRSESFSSLRGLLTGTTPVDDVRAAATLRALDEAPEIEGVLSDPPGDRSLRSLVAHYTSLQVGIRNAFTLTRLAAGRLLIFDCVALDYPVLATTRKIVILTVVATYLREDIKLTRSGCRPVWDIPTVVFDDFLDETGTGPVFAVCGPTPDGANVRFEHLRPDVMRHARPFPAGRS